MSTGPIEPNNLANIIGAAVNQAIGDLRQDVQRLSDDIKQGIPESPVQQMASSVEQYLNIAPPSTSSSTQKRPRGGRTKQPVQPTAQTWQDWFDEQMGLPPLGDVESPEYTTPQEDIDFQPLHGPGSREQKKRSGSFDYGVSQLPERLRKHRTEGWFKTAAGIAEDFGLGAVAGVGTALMAGSAARWGTQSAINAILEPAQQIAAPGMSQGSRQVVGGMANAASSLAGGIAQGAAIGSIIPGVGTAVGAVIGGALEVAKLPQQIMDWSDALLKSQFQIAAFNGTIQKAMMETERREFLRNIESGKATGGGTLGLSQSYQDLQDELRPIKDSVTNDIAITLRVGVELLRQQVSWLKFLNDIGLLFGEVPKLLQKIVNAVSKEEEDASTSFDEWMKYWKGKPINPQGPPKK